VRLYAGDDVDLVRRTLVASGSGPVAPGAAGSQILEALRPAGTSDLDHERLLRGEAQHLGPDEVVLWKPRWSAFFRTPLDAHLRTRNVDTVVIAGCNFPNCPRATAFDASELDYRTILAADALSGATPDRLDEMERIGVLAVTTDDLCRGLRQAAA
jgi:nicotinamidase-related amidase